MKRTERKKLLYTNEPFRADRIESSGLFLFPVTKREWCLSGDSEKIGRKYCTNFELMVKFCYYVRKIKNNGAIL